MISVKLSTLLTVLVMVYPLTGFSAETEKSDKPSASRIEARGATTTAETSTPVYKPPMRGAPGGRVGGGTRGTGRSVFVLSVLAPDHTGLTASEQPALYWYISSATSSPVEITLLDPRVTKPLVQHRIETPITAGVHSIRLSDHGIRLEPGIAYRWYIAVIPDANRRAKDLLAGGVIERSQPPDALRTKLSQAAPTQAPSIYAEAGYWYDAIAALSTLIESAPNDASLRNQRAALLAQVGVPEISE